jgi:16S rRNA (uracil1498-N3)-methyltransferase
MARELRRLLVCAERLAAAAPVPLLEAEHHYLVRVLRLRNGDRFAVIDGVGHLWQAVLQGRSAWLQQPFDHPLQHQPPPLPALQLAVAWPRRDGEVLLRMAVELGIDAVVPLQAERSVASERWNPARAAAVVREAVEQCERLWAPQLADPVAASAWWTAGAAGASAWLATTRHAGLVSLDARLLQLQGHPRHQRLSLAIGPEGGWSPAEEADARSAGWQPVSLGPTILRTGTAAVAGAALLTAWRARLAGGST